MTKKNWIPAFAGMTLVVAACSGPAIKHQVLTPPPSSPRTQFFLEKPEVQSREVGEAAWQRNAAYGEVLTQALRAALQEAGKTLGGPPAAAIRAQVYVAYGAAPVKAKDSVRSKAHVEVRLQLLDGGTVRYSTHTQAPIKAAPFAGWGWGPDSDQIIREVLEKSAQDFVSRL
jgi:hypothetical protein